MKKLLSGIFLILFSAICSFAQRALTLDDCCRIAVENNMQMKYADFAIEQAELQVKNSSMSFLPKFSASGGYLYTNKNFLIGISPSLSTTLDIGNACFAGIILEQPVYTGGKILSARKMANVGKTVALLNKKKTIEDVRIETEEAYWNVIKAEELNKVSIKYNQLVSELYANVEKMIKAGMISNNELLKVRVKLNEAELSMKRSANSVTLAKMALCHVMGLPLARNIEVSGNIECLPLYKTDCEFSVRKRLEYKLMSESINLKQQQIRAVRSDFLPQIGLVAGYNYIDGVKMNGQKLLNDDVFSIMLAIKIPLFHWGEGYRKLKSAKIEKRKAEILRDEMVGKMELEMMKNSSILDEAQLEVELTETALEYAEDSLKESRECFESGMEKLTDYLDAQVSWQKAYYEVISAKTKYNIAKSKYLRSLGR